MSKRFAGITATPSPRVPNTATPSPSGKKVTINGSFSPEMRDALKMLALKRGMKLHELMTEAFDDVLRKHGESPIGG